MPVIANNYVLLSYDTWLKNYKNYINIISHRFYLKQIGLPPELQEKSPYFVSEKIKNIIETNIDWELEESLGFHKRI